MAESCMAVLFTQLRSLRILNASISQDSVATPLTCGRIFNYVVTKNLLLSLPVKELSKSVSIWQN